jgi:hypothetical protein
VVYGTDCVGIPSRTAPHTTEKEQFVADLKPHYTALN